MANPDDKLRVDLFPTVQEIIEHAPLTRCDDCGRNFQNASACRFHQLKQHLALDVSDSNERRIFKRTTEQQRVIMAYHCPDPMCSSKKAWFDGIRNLKQHFFRAHTEKKLVCDKCGFKAALEKDLNYHMKARCPMRLESVERKNALKAARKAESSKKSRKKKATTTTGVKLRRSSRRRRESTTEEEEEEHTSESPPTPSSTVVQPIFLIVNEDNMESVVETIRKTLNPADISLNDIGREVQMQNARFAASQAEKETSLLPPSTSTFGHQYDEEPTTSYCERGTMMNETPLHFFDPPFGEEFGDMGHEHTSKPFDYSGPSTSQHTQTRSFGTMFENVTTCNTGTSMIDESYMSEFLRDIETQTPTYMLSEQQAPAQHSSDEWPPWRMTDGDI